MELQTYILIYIYLAFCTICAHRQVGCRTHWWYSIMYGLLWPLNWSVGLIVKVIRI